MKLVSWNVNGIRASVKKGFFDRVNDMNPDVLCLQETKAQDDQVREALFGMDDFKLYSNSAVKKGYSGTAILSKEEPINVTSDIGIEEHDQEGRVLTAEFNDFFLVNVYVPNSGSELARLDYRQKWDADFLKYFSALQAKKPVVVCGDLNVAHRDIDLARPKPNYNNSAGYMQEEIDGIDNIINAGFVDTFRHVRPEEEARYSWWSFRANARANNVGWRIDYFLTSDSLTSNIKDADILQDVHGSDHCPVMLELAI